MKKQNGYFKSENLNISALFKSKSRIKIIICSLTSLILYSCSSKVDSKTLENKTLPIISLQKKDTVTFKEYPTSLEGVMDVEIRSRVEGHLTELFVDEGVYVNKGYPLFKIDDLPYKEQYNQAKAYLNASENALVIAKLELDRLIPLVENKISSDYELKIAQTNYKIAIAKVAQAKSGLETAKINLDFTTIKAPISGYIGRIPKKIGSLISPSDTTPLTNISNIDKIFAYFSLSEIDFIDFKQTYPGATLMDKIDQVQAVSLLLADNTNYGEKGKIDMINGQFDKTTGSIILRAVFPNSKALIRSGNTGKIQMQINHKDVFIIPQSATVDIQDKTFVYALDQNNKVYAQTIQILTSSGSNYLCKADLKFGSRIVTKGIDTLSDGEIIIPTKEKL